MLLRDGHFVVTGSELVDGKNLEKRAFVPHRGPFWVKIESKCHFYVKGKSYIARVKRPLVSILLK